MIKLDRTIARSVAFAVGDRHRRDNGRINRPWDESDWNAACDEYDRLMDIIEAVETQQAGPELPTVLSERQNEKPILDYISKWPEGVDGFTAGYLGGAEWGVPEEYYRKDRIKGWFPDAIERAKRECREFQVANVADLDLYYQMAGRYIGRAGRNFWLARNTCITGFWEDFDATKYPDGRAIIDRLTTAARATGSRHVCVAENGYMYLHSF
jgi:hypothetical protein